MLARVREDAGSGKPLVYVPGIDGTGELLLGARERFAAEFRLVRLRYELGPGAPPGEDDYPHLASSVVDALDECDIGSAILLAESFGGPLGLQIALDHPERVSALAIVNSFSHYRMRARLALTNTVMPRVPPRLARFVRRHVGPPMLMGPRRDPEMVRAFREVEGLVFDEGYLRRARMVRGVDLRPRLGEIRCPVALFASERDGIVDSLPQAREMAAAIEGATMEIIPRGGHIALPLADEPWVERIRTLAARAEAARAVGA
ncbi:MAG: alpha/beta hydrolase [Planctomycetota bacterium]|jgi:pimeloyl-ACP methyl ester carboxylesterase|nr:alpha/beta hydrolase [Planctomycetota bacterium]MDP6989927.1 alpha/beta hydrolase [Planctomycetota bacterium]